VLQLIRIVANDQNFCPAPLKVIKRGLITATQRPSVHTSAEEGNIVAVKCADNYVL
jgi:hypothetical protein